METIKTTGVYAKNCTWACGYKMENEMGLSAGHIMVVVLLVVLLFGTGKISGLMGDVAKGIKSFKKGLADDDTGEKSTPAIDLSAENKVNQES